MPPDVSGEAVALHRYTLIAEALASRLTPRERGLVVRGVAAQVHQHPDGSQHTVSRDTLDRWIRAYRAQGFAGLHPRPRSDQGAIRRHPELFAEAAALRKEQPARSAAQIATMLQARHGISVSARTVRDRLSREGLQRAVLTADTHVFGRYEATRPNERWIGDVLVGPWVPHPRREGSQRAKLFLLVDDHSRLLVHGRWVLSEDVWTGQQVLRAAIVRRGLPEQLHTDNGSAYTAHALARTCAVLGIRLVHSRPYRPQGRGKQERLNRVIRERFILEAEAVGIADMGELNERFQAFAERVLNARVHRETGQTPIARFLAGGPPRAADPALMADAFRWSCMRTVNVRTATVSFEGRRYEVDAALRGRKVELRYDPTEPTTLAVFFEGRAYGVAVPALVGAHVHARSAPPPPAGTPTGVDYLGMVLADHEQSLGTPITYRTLPSTPEDQP
ncbi:MAG: DDE-type integrase/transposase/recombinase [Candidatus Dormibacteria bacterium]